MTRKVIMKSSTNMILIKPGRASALTRWHCRFLAFQPSSVTVCFAHVTRGEETAFLCGVRAETVSKTYHSNVACSLPTEASVSEPGTCM